MPASREEVATAAKTYAEAFETLVKARREFQAADDAATAATAQRAAALQARQDAQAAADAARVALADVVNQP